MKALKKTLTERKRAGAIRDVLRSAFVRKRECRLLPEDTVPCECCPEAM